MHAWALAGQTFGVLLFLVALVFALLPSVMVRKVMKRFFKDNKRY